MLENTIYLRLHDVKVKGYLLKIKKPQIHSIYSFGTSSGGKLTSKNVMSLTREKKEKKRKANKNISIKTHIHTYGKKGNKK